MKTDCMSFKMICLTITGLLFASLINGQENFQPGYIINLQKDTIRGFVDYRNWEKNPSDVVFKMGINELPTQYRSIDITGFGIQDEHYMSAIVERESTLNSFSDGPYSAQLITELDSTFLQTLIGGSKSLYYLKDKNGIDQFYIHQDTGFTLLIFKKYMKVQNENKGNMENRTFVGQLIKYLQECDQIQDKLKDTKYKRSDLEKLFVEYYACTNSSIAFHKKEDKIIAQLGVWMGPSITSLQINSESNYLGSVDFNSSTTVAGGLTCDFILPRSQRKWSILTELMYTSYKTSGHYDDLYNPATITFEYAYLKLNTMLRYRYPLGKVSAYANIGMSNGLVVSEVNEKKDESMFHPDTIGPAMPNSRGYEQGLVMGIGLSYYQFSIEVRYEAANGFSSLQNVGTPTKRLYFLAGYQF